jgi:hypothetical protein
MKDFLKKLFPKPENSTDYIVYAISLLGLGLAAYSLFAY